MRVECWYEWNRRSRESVRNVTQWRHLFIRDFSFRKKFDTATKTANTQTMSTRLTQSPKYISRRHKWCIHNIPNERRVDRAKSKDSQLFLEGIYVRVKFLCYERWILQKHSKRTHKHTDRQTQNSNSLCWEEGKLLGGKKEKVWHATPSSGRTFISWWKRVFESKIDTNSLVEDQIIAKRVCRICRNRSCEVETR